ncbi:MAG: adenylate cyclase, partial [Candidatus Tectomicrobia bacterium]|nr:adenylate cyclase [Candidatus Tectomicrobia bacterium]
ILQFREDHTETEKIQRLETSLEQYRLPLHESMPLFASLLSLPLPENRYPHLTLSPQHQRQKTLESLVAILLEQAERQPVLFIIEDLHWLDPTTLEFTDLLIDQTPTACVFVLLTCRPEFQPTWSHRSYLMEMTLNRLPRHQIARMAEQVAGGKGLPTEVVEQLADKTDGVPLYVEEMTKALFESGHMKEVDEAYELTDSIGSLTIPVTLQDSLMSRLDRLVTAKAVAQYAAVIGRQFSYELLQAVSQLDTSTLQRELERLVEAELIYQRGLPPQATYMFKHALIRDAAYESLLRRRRQGYHRRIAEVLEERFLETTETQPELLAHHYAAAGLHPQSLTAWQQAGTQAMARSAYREAVSCFEQALESLAQLPAAPETQAGAMDLRFALRNALLPLSEHERILDHLDAAERLAETLNDDHQLGQIAYYRCIHFMALGHYDRAIVAGKHALTLAASNGDFHVQVVAQTNLGFVYNMIADYRQAMTYSRQAIKALSGPLVFEGFGQLLQPALVARSMLTFCYAETGEFRDGLATAAEALRVAEEITQPYGLVVACNTLGALHYHQGDLCQALPLLERSYQLCQDANILLQLPRAASFLGAAYARDGRIADAQPHVAYMVAYLAAGNQVVMLGHILTVLGEALLCMGRVEEADAMAQRLLEHAKIHEGSGHQVHALRLLAEVAAHRDRSEVSLAETHYQQALVLAVELGMRPLQAHCHRGLGTLYSQTGQAEQARTELSTAIRMYRDMEMTFWLPQVEAVLAAVNG